MLASLAKILSILNSETSAWAIAFGVALGLFLGLGPLVSLQGLFILFIVCFFRVNIAFLLLSFALSSAFAYLVDHALHQLGESVLMAESLQGLWTGMYDQVWARLLQFNHTITMGALVIGVATFLPVLFAVYYLVKNYRSNIQNRIGQLPMAQFIKGTKFWSLYQKATRLKRGLSV